MTPVEEIKSRLDILELVREYVPELRRAGINWKARCPFHAEKSPSFMVHPGRQTFRCFGCSEGGDIFSFVQKIEGIEFPEALRLLAAKANVVLRAVDPKLTSAKTRMLDLLAQASEFFERQLESPVGAVCQNYLLAERKMNSETIRDWQLGYAPAAWDALAIYLQSKGYTDREMVAAGVAIERSQGRPGVYDRFRNRLVFPIKNSSGQIVGFSARVLPGASDTEPKYVNTPQTLVYDKGKILFGYDRARDAIRKQGFAVIVEGQFDLIASHVAGIVNTVAVSGTALTPDHLRLLKRVTESIALSFDMDKAGEAAATRSIDLALAEGFEIKVITLPLSVKDPDECVQRDPSLWSAAVAGAQPFVAVAYERLVKNRNLGVVDEARRAVREFIPIIRKLASRVDQALWIHRLSSDTGLAESLLLEEVGKVLKTPSISGAKAVQIIAKDVELLERYLSLALVSVEPRKWCLALPASVFPEGELRDLALVLMAWYTTADSSSLVEGLQQIEGENPELAAYAELLVSRNRDTFTTDNSLETHEVIERELDHLVRHLQRRVLLAALRDVEQEIRQAEKLADQGALERLSSRFSELTGQLSNLTR